MTCTMQWHTILHKTQNNSYLKNMHRNDTMFCMTHAQTRTFAPVAISIQYWFELLVCCLLTPTRACASIDSIMSRMLASCYSRAFLGGGGGTFLAKRRFEN